MKKIFCRSLVLILSLSLFSCQNKSELADDIPCSVLADTAKEQIPIDLGYESYGGEHIKYYFEDTELDDDHALYYSVASEDINEFGIFHAPDTDAAEELYRLTERYLEGLLEEKGAFIGSYAPKELQKLEDAEVRAFGCYVAYAILSEDDRELFFDTVEATLRK